VIFLQTHPGIWRHNIGDPATQPQMRSDKSVSAYRSPESLDRLADAMSKLCLAPRANGLGEFLEQAVGFVPVDAGVGDALAVDEGLAGDEWLRASYEVALDHDTHNASIAGLVCAAGNLR
jgi:hypothetical protein